MPKYKMVSRAKINAWMTPMNMPNSFHGTVGNGVSQNGSRPMIDSMTPPAKMLPKSRSDRETGLAISSRTLNGVMIA